MKTALRAKRRSALQARLLGLALGIGANLAAAITPAAFASSIPTCLTPSCPVASIPPTGFYLSQFGSAGSGAGQFNIPDGIAQDSGGYIYVTDSSNYRVEKFTSTGSYVSAFGSHGSGAG
jgi:hypothetical protein